MTNQIIVLSIILTLISCMPQRKTVWIGSQLTQCQHADAQTECLKMYEISQTKNKKWITIPNTIEGFDFEEGYMKKIELRSKSNKGQVKYSQIKEIQKLKDHTNALQGEWTLVQMTTKYPSLENSKIILQIDTDKLKIFGSAPCNSYNAMISVLIANNIEFGPIASSRKSCRKLDLENEYIRLLNTTNSYRITNNKLVLLDNSNAMLLTYEKKQAQSVSNRLHDIWIGRMIYDKQVQKGQSPRLEINLTDNKIYGYDGCNNFFGNVNLNSNNRIGFDAIGGTKKFCQDMEGVPNNFNRAMREVSAYQLKGLTLLLLNDANDVVLSFSKGD